MEKKSINELLDIFRDIQYDSEDAFLTAAKEAYVTYGKSALRCINADVFMKPEDEYCDTEPYCEGLEVAGVAVRHWLPEDEEDGQRYCYTTIHKFN